MDEGQEEMTGKEIERFMQLQAEEAIEALMKVVGGQMPTFAKRN